MKWTRAKANDLIECSTCYISLRHYISMTHTSYNNHFWYDYSVNGEKVLYGSFEAINWDEAEKAVVIRIKNELYLKAKHWNDLLENFDKEMTESENLL